MKSRGKQGKFAQALQSLDHALGFENKIEKDEIYYLGISKAFEVALEYAWKYLKVQIEHTGLEAFSPRDVMKVAARAGLIKDLELWLSFIDARNIAVHDYIGFDRKGYLGKIKEFAACAKELLE